MSSTEHYGITESNLNPAPGFDRSAWLRERKRGVGGSEAAAVFNEGYSCSRALWYDKLDVPRDYGRTAAEESILKRGTRLEDKIAEEYEEVTGKRIFRSNRAIISKEHAWMRVNVDRKIKADERGPGILECKSANEWVFKKMLSEGLPAQYVMQMQHALAVTGYTWGAFAVLEPSSWQFLQFEMERDEQLIAILIEKEREFWNMVEGETIPDPLPDTKDPRCSKCQWRRSCRGEANLLANAGREFVKIDYEEDDSLADLVNDYKTAKFAADDATAVADLIKDRIKVTMGDRQAVSVPSAGARVIFKEQKGSSRWDSRGLEADYPELATKYKKVSEPTRPFRIIEV